MLKPSQCIRPDVAGVLDLDAAVHDDRQAALLGDPRALPLITPNWRQSAPAPIATASRAIPGTASGARNTSTMSTGTGTSSRLG